MGRIVPNYSAFRKRNRARLRRHGVYLGTESLTRRVCGQRHGSVVKGKRISSPPQYDPRDPQGVPRRLGESYCFDRDFPLIRSLRASAQRSASVSFSFALSFDYGGIIDRPPIKNGFLRASRGAVKEGPVIAPRISVLIDGACANRSRNPPRTVAGHRPTR